MMGKISHGIINPVVNQFWSDFKDPYYRFAKERMTGREVIHSRLKKCYFNIHTHGIQAKLGNVIRELDKTEVCLTIKYIADHAGEWEAIETRMMANFGRVYGRKFSCKNGLPVMSWSWWSSIRRIAKRLGRNDDQRM